MSRLSLKPGGEPGKWVLESLNRDSFTGWGKEFTGEAIYTFEDVPDSDLMDIRSTLSEYLDAKYEVVEPVKPSRWKSLRWWLGNAALVSLPIGTLWLVIAYPQRPPEPPSTGGVIDQLCMRPDIECSTSIRYVHPQAGVPHQERETYSADSLSQAHLEEQ